MDRGDGSGAVRPSVAGMTAWEVPGYDVLELLGFGTTGEVWRARERASGTVVALRRLAGGDRAAVAAVRREATVVRSLPSPHLVRLRTTVRAGGDDVLVLDHAAGGSLAALLARRGRLDPGEVVTVLAPVADALGQAHQHGLVHGRLGVSSVLLTAQGMPLLDGLGAASLTDAGAADPAADVAALGALG
ncbi:MAG: Serine/threonine protein kinase, partial [Frankiales bacterium]|nr:Serine/threonine protein kinase [Frankiales bacterium]